RPGMTRDMAQQELTTLTAQYASAPSSGDSKGMSEYTAVRVDATAGVPAEVAGAIAGFLGALLALAALVLMIASVNVASMLLARAVVRRREIAMRMALGATRRRLVRQLLVESLLLFGAGGIAGTALAFWGTRLLQHIDLPMEIPIELDMTPDARVLVVTLLVALVTGVIFGLAPALQGSRLDVQSTLRSDSAGAGRRRSRLRDGLIVGQIAMSLLLLSSAGLFIRALGRGRATDPGFSVDGVVTANIDVESAGYDAARARILFRDIGERMAAVPGVESVGWTRMMPLSMNTSGYDISIPSVTPPGGRLGESFTVNSNVVDEGYFSSLKIPLVRGRAFLRTDDAHAPRVAVVSETFAKRFFPTRDALGETFRMDSSLITIVGISKEIKFTKLDEEPAPFMYLPTEQEWRSIGIILLRTRGAPESVTGALIREMSAIDPSLPAPRITTLRQATAVALLPQRVAAAVTGALGLVGLLLAAVGLYGVLSFSTAQRTREIGVRLALGASRGGIMRMVLREGLGLVGIGVGAGLVLAFIGTRALRPFLFGLNPLDPITFIVIAATLIAVSAIATALPARRASGVNPMLSMREE
ncbi:MAG: FtsX-like permease family protein, partial [Gemmatimonadaceae bacterium]